MVGDFVRRLTGAAMVWTGREVVIWSGWSTAAAVPPYRDGAAYRPATGT